MKKLLLFLVVLGLSGLVLAAPVTIQVTTADGVAIPARIGVGDGTAVFSWNGQRVIDLQPGTHQVWASFHGEQISQEVQVGGDPLNIRLQSKRKSLLATEFDGKMDGWVEESGGQLAYLENGKFVLEEGTTWFWAGENDWEDYIYTISFTITNPLKDYYYVRLPFRAEGPWASYELWLEHRYVLLRRYDGSSESRADLVWSWSHKVTNNVHYTVEIVCKEDRFTGFLNGTQIFDVLDPDTFYYEGMVGLRTSHVGLEVDRAVVIKY